MPRLVSRADLARLANVSRPALTKQCKRALAPACHGDRIDLDHAAVQAFLRSHGAANDAPDRAPTKPAKRAAPAPADPTPAPKGAVKRTARPTEPRPQPAKLPPQPTDAGSSDDLEELAERVRPLTERFGTERGMHDWFLMLKNKEVIEAKRLENEATRRLRIPREFVTVHILSVLEDTRKRLLTDMPKTLAAQLFAMSRAGATLVEAEREVRAAVSSHLEAVNAKLKKTLLDVATSAAHTNAGTHRGRGALAR